MPTPSHFGKKPDLSYILPVFNKERALPYFFETLMQQHGEFSKEVIFIDDNSTDGSLRLLQQLANQHDFVQVISNQPSANQTHVDPVNVGPAIRLNQGARHAQGTYLALFDCDELLAPNAVETLLKLAKSHDADMVHGRCKVTKEQIETAPPPPEIRNAGSQIYEDPLLRVLGRRMVRMTWLVERELFERAGGCDESVFVQDESLPIRLSVLARRLVDTKAWITTAPQVGSHLSNSGLQSIHDKFMVYKQFLASHTGLPYQKRRLLFTQCVSCARRAQRYGAAFPKWALQLRYVMAKLGIGTFDHAELLPYQQVFQNFSDIKRTSNNS